MVLEVRAFSASDVDLGQPPGSSFAYMGNSADSNWAVLNFTLGTLPVGTAKVNIWFRNWDTAGGSAPNCDYTITDVSVIEQYTYTPPRDPKKTRITLSALDNATALAQVSESRGVAAVADLPELLENTTVPYLVNGSGGQVSGVQIVSINDNATLLDQIAVARDTDSGYVHIDRNNVLVAEDPESVSNAVVSVLDEAAYSDIDATFSFTECINSVTIKWLRYDSVANETTEILYGPYEDTASIEKWGLHPETFTFQGLVENPTAIAARAAEILAANAQPGRRINSVTLPIRNREDLDGSKALLDLYDLVRLKYARTSTDELARITTISHRITPKRWTMEVGFNADGSVARPVAVPSPSTFNDENPFLFMDHARAVLQGGGKLTSDSSGGCAWGTRFIVMGAGNNSLAPSGYFNITMPANGTVIPVHGTTGTASRTVASGLVPLGNWEALYYELPLRESGSAVNDGNFHIVGYTDPAAFFEVPAHWVFIVARNSDSATPYMHHWADGRNTTPWTALTYAASWVDYGGTYQPGQYKYENGKVILRGFIKTSIARASGSITITTLTGLGPPAVELFTAMASPNSTTGAASTGTAHTHTLASEQSSVRIDVLSSGVVNVVLNAQRVLAANAWVSLSGISWEVG